MDLVEKYMGNERNVKNGLGADGMSKGKLKTLLYKETKKYTFNKLYTDDYWKGPQAIWGVFNNLNLNWNITNSEYQRDKDNKTPGFVMPSRKVWSFVIHWNDNKGKSQKIEGTLTAAGAGSVKDPLSKYDINLVLY